MSKAKDITGLVKNKLTVIRFSRKAPKGGEYWWCKCECGVEKEILKARFVPTSLLISCGCIRLGKVGRYSHGMYNTNFYKIWTSMKMRCNNPKVKNYHNYGGRGITYVKRWQDFINFYKDMFSSYSNGLSLERKNVDGNYSKRNCKWIPKGDQKYNKRKPPILLKIHGEKLTIPDAAKKYNVIEFRMYKRQKQGFSDTEIIFGRNKV